MSLSKTVDPFRLDTPANRQERAAKLAPATRPEFRTTPRHRTKNPSAAKPKQEISSVEAAL
jgi:hypothetical protein